MPSEARPSILLLNMVYFTNAILSFLIKIDFGSEGEFDKTSQISLQENVSEYGASWVLVSISIKSLVGVFDTKL